MTPADSASTVLFLALLLVTSGYGVTCWFWPFKACRTCHGTGKLRSPFLRAIRLCPPCNGTGLRLRPGRRVINAARRIHRANHHRH
ncbi:hypothetical protein QFW96_23150 [Saccharopolyspora sp. TS4A08]|uniref:Uncharacterized protein n=1 Tax=Saccharopolyspora ipomoeae TaxID=3042027 RepID=A0ABT6PU63_9PSEU|nr:hypothetical protein [Saccharopolyspora sp. TS4A08]MDI2031544.1 hypothetical protein [Saccharopolyspora sp. TS4A08]